MVRALHTSAPSKAAPISEQTRDARARAWAYVFSCWHAKQKAVPPQIAGDHPNDSTAKEVSHVEQSSDEASSIVHQEFNQEKE